MLIVLFIAALAADLRTTLEDAGEGDRYAQGRQSSSSFFLPYPPGYASGGGNLTLRLEGSPLLRAAASSITVRVQGNPVTSARALPGPQTLNVVLPPHRRGPAPTGLYVELDFELRLTDDPCEPNNDPGQWVRVDASSSAEMSLVEVPLTLSDVHTMLRPALDAPVGFRVGQDALHLAGAAAWSIGYATRTGNAPRITLGPSTRTVHVSSSRSPSLSLERADGALALHLRDDDTHRAALALTRPERLWGTQVDVKRAPRPEPVWRTGVATFDRLGFGTVTARGGGVHDRRHSVVLPSGRHFRDGAQLILDIAAASALRPETSGVTVFVRDLPIGTVNLKDAVDGRMRTSLYIPDGVLSATRHGDPVHKVPINLQLQVDAIDDRCDTVATDAIWLSVLPTSYIHLPSDPSRADLSLFPDGLLDQPLFIILPDTPSAALTEAALQLSAAIGATAATVPSQPPQVRTSLPRDTNAHLIYLGAEDDPHMPVAARAEVRPALLPAGTQPRATARIGRSSQSSGYAMTLAGTPDGVLDFTRVLADAPALSGRVAVLLGDEVHQPEAVVQRSVAWNPQVLLPEDPTQPRRTGAAILLGAFLLGLILVLARVFQRR